MGTSVVLIAHPPKENLSVGYPLGLAYIASVLREKGIPVEIRDFCRRERSLSRAVQDLAALNPGFLGFSVYTHEYKAVRRMIGQIRRVLPSVKIIAGGPHVSALPEFSLADLGADFAVVGEGEFITPEIIARVQSGERDFTDLKGLAYWNDGRVVLNPGCNIITDLDSLPSPAWDLLPPSEYTDAHGQIFSKKNAVASIVTSRGCPHACTFCSSYLVYGRSFRTRSATRVADEIEFLKRAYSIDEINLYDATFSEDRAHARRICMELIARKLDISWRPCVGVRLDTLDSELIRLFRESGCYELSFGLETHSRSVLQTVKKPLQADRLGDMVRLIRENGISMLGFFIIGLPGETEDSIRQAIRFAGNSDIDYILFTHAVPLPGAEMSREFYRTVDLKEVNWDDFYFYTGNPYPLAGIPAARLNTLYFFAYVFCYSRWKRVRNILKDIAYHRKPRVRKILLFTAQIIRNLV
jgi:radical SAM superfamily enzyme YgiQ (UPF0313 family)